jgi:transglutaminase-like putative cysteine protease
MARRFGTDGSLLLSLPWTLAALGFALLAHVPFLPIWITVAFIACAAVRYVIEKRRLRLPSAWVRMVLAAICFAGVWLTYGTVSGVGPGSALLAVMAALKLLETRKRRDQFVLLFIAIFLVMASLLRDQFLWSLPYLAVAIMLIMTAWLRMSSSKPVPARRSFLTTGRLLAYALPLAIAMWVFFPRLSAPFWSVPIDTSRASSGLSDEMSPGDISSLSMSDAVAFRVRFDSDVPAPRDRYWRGIVLNRFDGRSWKKGSDPRPDPKALNRISYSGNSIDYDVTLEPTSQRWIFALELPSRTSLRQSFMTPDNLLVRVLPIDQRIAYKVTSFTSFVTDLDISEFSRNWHLELPVSGNRRTRELAQTMRAAADGDREFIRTVLNKFNKEEYFYTLEPPPLGANSVDRFLFDTRQGFCEHYASAFTVMMRAAGIPSRVVVGYQGGELNPLGGHMVVRQSDAHAWSEVWLPGEGWTRVDPTAAVAPERVEIGISEALFSGIGQSWGFSAPSMLVYQFEMAVDLINAKWDEWVLGYGPENQERLMRWLGMNDPNWRKMLLTLIGIVTGLVLLISFALYRRYKPPKRDRAAVLYRRYLRKSGVKPITGETPAAFANRARGRARVSDISLDRVTSAYLDARYGTGGDAALKRLRHAIANVS